MILPLARYRGEKTAQMMVLRFLKGEVGWGGRIRTFTVLINSEVSYQLDHAPAGCRRPRFDGGHSYPR